MIKTAAELMAALKAANSGEQKLAIVQALMTPKTTIPQCLRLFLDNGYRATAEKAVGILNAEGGKYSLPIPGVAESEDPTELEMLKDQLATVQATAKALTEERDSLKLKLEQLAKKG